MSTTDLHGTIWPYDYQRDCAAPGIGLAGIGRMVAEARAEVDNCLLFDVGDLLQGTALADLAAETGLDPHPVIAAMNALGYDAATLGNHDLDYGLEHLTRAAQAAQFPLVCSNLSLRAAAQGSALPGMAPSCLLERTLRDVDGRSHRLRIGVVGAAPPQTALWSATRLEQPVQAAGIVASIAAATARLRRQGADLVVALSHSGLGGDRPAEDAEDASRGLAGIEGIAAILAGHAHRRFPGPDYAPAPDLDPRAGTIDGVPAVMAGAYGSDLGMIDLVLERRATGWQCVDQSCALRRHRERAPDPHAAVLEATRAAHTATLHRVRRPVGLTRQRLHSVLALSAHAPALQLLADAQARWAAQAVAGTPLDGLPILSGVAPFGMRAGTAPIGGVDIPPGPILERHLHEISPFPNALVVQQVDGRHLRLWLERAASVFRQLSSGARDAVLIEPEAPGYTFDIVHGVTYSFDLSRPAAYCPASGRFLGTGRRTPGRVAELLHEGRPVRDTDRFALATNSFRAAGGSGYPVSPERVPRHVGRTTPRAALRTHLDSTGPVALASRPVWHFAPLGASAVFSAPGDCLGEILQDPTRALEPLGSAPDGAQLVRIHL